MESAVYSLFRVNLRNLVKNKIHICKDYHIQPSEIDKLIYFEYEWYLDEIREIQTEEEARNKEQEDKYKGMGSFSDMQRNIKMPQMPQVSTPSLPKVSVPNF